MKHIFKMAAAAIFAGAVTFSALPEASAQTPSDVMIPYKAYRAALEAGDAKLASKNAYKAWQAAEDSLGDNKTTGDLAQNFADLGAHSGNKKQLKKAYSRAIELSPLHKEDGVALRLEREVKYSEYLVKTNQRAGLTSRLKKAANYAEANGYGNSTFLGEIYTMLAQLNIDSARHENTEKYAEKALAIFEAADDGIESYHPYMARLYSGYGKEGQNELIPAVMEYQDVMTNVENKLPKDHPFVSRALGRWLNMRHRIVRDGLFEEAEAAGLCECWPYDKKRNETIRPITRVPPVMPRNAQQSGFSLVEFDLDDTGNVINPRLLESWPEDVFDASSLKAVEQWKYSPRVPEEVDGDRTEIVTTIRYVLENESGRPID